MFPQTTGATYSNSQSNYGNWTTHTEAAPPTYTPVTASRSREVYTSPYIPPKTEHTRIVPSTDQSSEIAYLQEQLRQKDDQITKLKSNQYILEKELLLARAEVRSLRQSAHPQIDCPRQSSVAAYTQAGGSRNPVSVNQRSSGDAFSQWQNPNSRAQEQIDAMIAKTLYQEEILEQDAQLARRLQQQEGFVDWPNPVAQRRPRANSEDEYQSMLELQEDLGHVEVGLTPHQIQRLGYTILPRNSPYGNYVK